MKRNFYALGLMLAATFTLTNCTKEFENPSAESEGVPFEIVASTVDTKTVNDGMATKWAEGDQINLFHAVGETTEYVNDNAFSLKDLEEGKFEGKLGAELDSQEEYDWFAFYPYSSYITTPAVQTKGYTYIGGRSDTPQTQNGANNMTHIAGKNYPLYGKVVAVPAATQPELTMSHASTLLEVKVTNTLETELAVENVKFTAPAGTSLVGTFYLNITGDEVVYTDGQFVSNVAELSVSNATLAADASASFYLAVKPFTAAKNSKLCLSVNGYERELTMPNDVTFSAGKIKTLNFSYDKEEAPAPEGTTTATLTFDAGKVNRLSYTNSEQVWFQNGITFKNIKSSSTTNIGNYANPVRMYKQSQVVIDAPGNITKIVFNSEPNDSDDAKKYLDFLKTAVGTNTTEGTKVTVQLDGTTSSVTYTMPGQVRLYDITVTYLGEAYVPPTLESIEISGEYQTKFVKGDTYAFGGKVIATYDDNSTRDVTALSSFTGYDMNTVGKQEVTVSYEDKSVTYEIEVQEPVISDKKQYTFTITKDDFVTTSYAANNTEHESTATASDGTTMGVKWTSNQVMQQSGTMQWKKSDGCIYNTTNLGTIDKVEITSTAGTFTTYKGTSSKPTTNGDGGYFQIKVGGSATGKVTSIKVTFTK